MGSRDRDGTLAHRAAAGLGALRGPEPFASHLHRAVLAVMGVGAGDLRERRTRDPREAIAVRDLRACVT